MEAVIRGGSALWKKMSSDAGGWDGRVRRARHLAAKNDSAAALLEFYAVVLTCQGDLARSIRAGLPARPTGSLEDDLSIVCRAAPAFVGAVIARAPETLAAEGRRLLDASQRLLGDALLRWWGAPSDREFFPKAILQPYARSLSDAGVTPADRTLPRTNNRCPFCGGSPQLAILDPVTASAVETGGRRLLCATCLGTWPFRRVLCARCGEEDEHKLAYFRSPAFDHLRVDACDTCRHYLKTVDLTRLGVAVPLVDEVAGAPLDMWAREHGYEKIELNLLGL